MMTSSKILKKLYLPYFNILYITVFALLSSACVDLESDAEKQQKEDEQKITDYLNKNNIVAEKSSNGYYYETLTTNESGEELEKNDIIDLYYSVKVLNGKLVGAVTDTSAFPARLKLDYYSVIPEGLLYGISQMKTGEKYRFYMPSWLAYGSISTSEFASNSNLIIDVEVLAHYTDSLINNTQIDSIQEYVDHSGLEFHKSSDGLFYHHIEEGEGESPVDYSTVTFNFTRRYLDSTLIVSTKDSGPVTLVLGNGQAVKGLEEGLKWMKKGGQCLMIMPEALAFQQSICVVPKSIQSELFDQGYILTKVEPYSIIMYEVELLDIK